MNEVELDALARELYHLRTRSPREMTDERWEKVKRQFPGTVRMCREDVLEMHEMGEL